MSEPLTSKPLWDDVKINSEMLYVSKVMGTKPAEPFVMSRDVHKLLCQMRTDYEQALARVTGERDAQINNVEQICLINDQYADENNNLRQRVRELEAEHAAAMARIESLERELAEAKSDAEYWHDTFMTGENNE